MAKHAFDKFIGNAPTGAKKKEMIKVEKRMAKKEAQAIGEKKRKEMWEKKHGIVSQEPTAKATKPKFKKEEPKFKKDEPKAPTENRPRFGKRPIKRTAETEESKPPVDNTDKQSTKEGEKAKKFSKKYVTSNSDKYFKGDHTLTPPPAKGGKKTSEEEENMPLNKFVAYAGICGRREAAALVKEGVITVNGDVVYEPGYKVLTTDEVVYKGKKLVLKKNLVYILLNKPKDYITTSADPEGRKTVMDLLKDATKERIYPIGRLDRNTTGVLLLTNDGELAQKLTHPGYQVKKVYAVKLDKPVTKKDFDSILSGITLEDGTIQADGLAYADAKDRTQVGIEIHSGKNRIVRRIFEHLGYEVKSLDRVMFANLTKKNVERGTWRMLQEKEVRLLKHMNQSFLKKNRDSEIPTDLDL